MRGIALCLLVAGGVAHANGRAPTTNGMYFKPGDAHSLYVRSTFGLLISHDDGCTFDWVCEDNIGYSGNFDPDYAITSDGTIFATTPHGLRASHDGGCSFATVTPDESVDSLDLSSTGAVWIGTATAGVSNDIYQSIDGGATFQSVGLATSVAFVYITQFYTAGS
ncbi:MAG TPA: hypothetical protein VGO00_17490, partial [Kofleriaceae bacterium]|nr:hypothetical protein [Kofleriaceae bacterium]